MQLKHEVMDAAILILGKSAGILNVRGKRICFLIYGLICMYWCVIDVHRGLYAQAISACVSILINIYGWWYWGKNKKEEKTNG